MSIRSDILGYLRDQEQAFISFLETLTLCESPSTVPESQIQMRQLLVDAFEEIDYCSQTINGCASGGHLYASPKHRISNQTTQLLLGHYDTVWPVGTLKNMPFDVDGNVVRGPGVYDMKGGIAQMVFALKAMRDLGISPSVTPVVFLNSDEEIGSRESGRNIQRLAKCVDRVYVLEPSLGLNGKLKTTRKGVGRFHVVIKGKAAHAGLDPTAGASAILEIKGIPHE